MVAVIWTSATSLHSLSLTRSPVVGHEGWRDIKASDRLPPNLKALSVCNCMSATPFLALTSLEALSIRPHCRMPASELQSLSVMTHITTVKLGYARWGHHVGWDRAAQQGLSGRGCVPALHELHLHNVQLIPSSPWVQQLSGLTTLTRLVWDGVTFIDLEGQFRLLDTGIGDIIGPAEGGFDYCDAGLSDLGKALPQSLVEVTFRHFMPGEDMGAFNRGYTCRWEEDELWGLMRLKEAVLALPNLSTCEFSTRRKTVAAHCSERGAALIHALLDGDWRQPIPVGWCEEFDRTYPDFEHGW